MANEIRVTTVGAQVEHKPAAQAVRVTTAAVYVEYGPPPTPPPPKYGPVVQVT